MSNLNYNIKDLTPRPIWHFFDQMCRIPHPSKHEVQLTEFIKGWAQAQGLTVRQDEVGNLIIKKSATAGMENRKGVILQAHLDMVPQKNEATVHDFSKDPIKAYVDGDWVSAEGTTLGADNGIGASACLAVLASTEIEHGPLEVLFTIDEEAGMTGAFGLKPGYLDGDILINTDTEQEGEVYMGCAGGMDCVMNLPLEREAMTEGHVVHLLSIKGLKGGHSGTDINIGRANASKLLARFIFLHTKELGLKVLDFTGGTIRNAIPREAFALVAIPAENSDYLNDLFVLYQHMLELELGQVETDLYLTDIKTTSDLLPLTDDSQWRLMSLINASINGVIRMSDEIKGVVETSLNLGIVGTGEDKAELIFLVRSLTEGGKEQVEVALKSIGQLAGAEVSFQGNYPGWKPDPDSEIMHIFRDCYQSMYGRLPDIMVIHAGLECGLFKNPYPNLDMLSFGPTIMYPHSPDEKVSVSSVGLFWEQLIALLKLIPVKA